MGKRILIIQGHPDCAGGHLGHALASAYAEGAQAAGHTVRWTHVARLGMVGNLKPQAVAKWQDKLQELGADAE